MNTEFMDAIYEADPRPPAWKDSASAASEDPVIAAILEFGDGGYPNLRTRSGHRLRGGSAWPR